MTENFENNEQDLANKKRRQQVDNFLVLNQNYLPVDKIGYIKERLLKADTSQWSFIQSFKFKSPMVVWLLSFFFGCLGVDRFVTGDIALGVLKLLTCGGCGVFTFIDWLIICRRTKEVNLSKLLLII
ncbi:MAG: TM2 domain-containing protein [Clostridia bacterium]|nr:TM2 domain-containing protein [Clostridia bacterium]